MAAHVEGFRAERADNVRFVWILMASSFHPRGGRIPAAAYYRGDDVIEWLAADGYNWFGCLSSTWRPFSDAFADFVAWATPHRRPLMVAEWGSLEGRDPPLATGARRPVLELLRPGRPLRLQAELLTVVDGPDAAPWPASVTSRPACPYPRRGSRAAAAAAWEGTGSPTSAPETRTTPSRASPAFCRRG